MVYHAIDVSMRHVPVNQTVKLHGLVQTTKFCHSFGISRRYTHRFKQERCEKMEWNRKVICRADEGDRDVARRAEGRSTYRPSSYTELIDDAVGSIIFGTQDKLNRMEVEFPSVSNVDGYKGSSDLYIDSNIQLAISAGRKIYSTTAMKVHILLPDEAEYKRAYKLYVDSYTMLLSLTEIPRSDASPWSLLL